MITNFYDPIILGDTQNLSRDIWLEWRRHGPGYANKNDPNYLDVVIGGSDVSCIFGVNPYKTIDDLYDDKCGIPHKIDTIPTHLKESQESGTLFEGLVAEQFKRKMEKEGYIVSVTNDTNFYQCGTYCCDEEGVVMCDNEENPILKYPFACANLDRIVKINGDTAILECKTISASNISTISDWKKNIVPFEYELQCRYYMAIKNIDVCYICCCWGFRFTDMAIIKLTRNFKLENIIMDSVKNFAECVRNRKRPNGIQQSAELVIDYYKRFYGIPDERERKSSVLELETDYMHDLFDALDIEDQISALNNQIEILEERKKCILANISGRMLKNGYLKARLDTGDFGSFNLSLKPTRKNSKFDRAKFETEEKELYAKYCTAFDEKAFKEDISNIEFVKKYTIPITIDPNGSLSISLNFKEKKLKRKGK